MKQFMTGLLALCLLFSVSMVQAQAPAAKKQAKTAAAPLKKDGTPDKRYKANQAPKGPVKKDGTADMRYKANQKKKA